jgi:hypothetical protein
MVMLDQLRRAADEFDILHFHIDYLHYPLFRDLARHTITTAHGRQDLPDLRVVYATFPESGLISISDHQRHFMAARSMAAHHLSRHTRAPICVQVACGR